MDGLRPLRRGAMPEGMAFLLGGVPEALHRGAHGACGGHGQPDLQIRSRRVQTNAPAFCVSKKCRCFFAGESRQASSGRRADHTGSPLQWRRTMARKIRHGSTTHPRRAVLREIQPIPRNPEPKPAPLRCRAGGGARQTAGAAFTRQTKPPFSTSTTRVSPVWTSPCRMVRAMRVSARLWR